VQEKDCRFLRDTSTLACNNASNTPLFDTHSSFDDFTDTSFDNIGTFFESNRFRAIFSDICVNAITLANESPYTYYFQNKW